MFKCQTVLLSQMTGFRGTATYVVPLEIIGEDQEEGGSFGFVFVFVFVYVAPLEIIGKIRRRAGDQTAEILPRLMMIELPCTGRRRDGRKRKRKGGQGGLRGDPGQGGGQSFTRTLTTTCLLAPRDFRILSNPLISLLCVCKGVQEQSHRVTRIGEGTPSKLICLTASNP